MARFRRRKSGDAEVDAPEEAESEESGLVDVESEAAEDSGFDRSAGPFDESEADLADQDLPRIDLGALRIPGLPDVAVQVEADPSMDEVRGVTAVAGDAAVQLSVFAAPRTDGLWDEIRAQMLTEMSATAGSTVREIQGPFGTELRGNLPVRTSEGRSAIQPVRFTGVDGPRWFLRAVFLGRAAVEPDADDDLHRVVRQTIVNRGADAMAPGDPLPLRLPDAEPATDQAEAEPDIDPFERGPEITEVR